MDDNLREMGVGDLTVPKRMKAFGEAFYGRAAAYDLALDAGEEPLAQALCKNILNGRASKTRGGWPFMPKRPSLCLTGQRRGGVIGWIVEIPIANGPGAQP